MGINLIRQWQDSRKRAQSAKAIYYLLVMEFQNAGGRPGAGVELAKTADNALLARYTRRKYPQMEVTLLADKIVFSLRAGFDAVISESLRAHLEHSGLHGQKAIEAYAETAAAAKALGLNLQEDAKLVKAVMPYEPISEVDTYSVGDRNEPDPIPEK